ncbi:tyrosine-type recombinase/integrase, partial [Erysipelatoclostridium ramosum]|uniref:tyrosine-type recombinase/integrase n=1 Tax=Thomasclavelia ramosa TaxID=1547 RepID=UPI001D065B6A
RLPVLLGEYAGLRIGEIAGLQVGDIDLEHRKIHIQRSLNRFPVTDAQGNLHSKLIYGKTKNGKERFVPMNDDL